MFSIAYKDIVEAVRQLAIDAAYHLPEDVLEALERARKAGAFTLVDAPSF